MNANLPQVNTDQNKHFILYILLALSLIGNIILAVFLIYTVRFQPIPKQTVIPSPTSVQPTQIDKQTSKITIPTDWKTYNSSTSGITFRYPPDYTVEETGSITDSSGINVTLNSPSSPKLGKSSQMATNDWLTVEIHVTSSPAYDTLKKFVEETDNSRNTPLDIGFQVLESTPSSIGVVTSEHQQWKDNQGNDGEAILFIHNDKRYDLLKFPANTTQQDIFNKIISSTQFL